VLVGVTERRVVFSRRAGELVGRRALTAALGSGLLRPVLRSLGITASVALSLIVHVKITSLSVRVRTVPPVYPD